MNNGKKKTKDVPNENETFESFFKVNFNNFRIKVFLNTKTSVCVRLLIN